MNLKPALGASAKFLAIVLLAGSLAACMTDSEQGGVVYTDDRGVANQPFPADYRSTSGVSQGVSE